MQRFSRKLVKVKISARVLKEMYQFLKSRGALKSNLIQLSKIGVAQIGDHSYGNPFVYFWDFKTRIVIGKYVSIADDVTFILGGEHRYDWVTTSPLMELPYFKERLKHVHGHPQSKGDIVVGNDVWIGHGATILSGVRIENGAVIAAGSVVTKNVDAYSIVGGNPARFIKYRFNQETIVRLLEISWWEWPEGKILDHSKFLLDSPDALFEYIQREH